VTPREHAEGVIDPGVNPGSYAFGVSKLTAILFSLSIGLRCQILKIDLDLDLDLELELPEHLAPEPRCTLWPWVSQRHS